MTRILRFSLVLTLLLGCTRTPAAPPAPTSATTPARVKKDGNADRKARETVARAEPARKDEKPASKTEPQLHPAGNPENWSNWRGPFHNGYSPDKDLPDKFSLKLNAKNSNLIWRAPYGGITTPILMNNRLYLIDGTSEDGINQQEQVVCLDAGNGEVRWKHKFNVFLTDIVHDRLGWANCVGDPETGYVYVQGTQGFLFCFNGESGKVIWQHSLTEEYGRVSGYGGRVTTPVIDGDLLLLSLVNANWGEQAIGGTRFVAFDKHTGKIIWWASTGYRVKNTYYSVPVVATINGERLVIGGAGDGGVHAFKVSTGEKVWSYLFGSGDINVSPVVVGNRVYIGQGETNVIGGTQGCVICLDAGEVKNKQPKLVWQVPGIKARYASPVVHEGRVYIPDDVGRLYCLDAKTGTQHWVFKYGRNSKGSPVLADGKIYITEVDSRFHILKPEDRSCKELYFQRFRGKGNAPAELNGSVAVANGKVYFMTNFDTYCIGKKDVKAPTEKAPSKAKESKPEKAGEPAHLQVVPADVTLTPGENVELKAYAFDAKGLPLGAVKVDWSLAGMLPPVYPIGFPAPPPPAKPPAKPPALQGKLSADSGTATKLTVAKGPPAQFGRVVATMGKLSAYVRVRVAPVLPYKPDFSKIPEGRTPAAWINTQGKFSIVTHAGKKVLSKRNNAPNILVARSHAFMTLPRFTNYTVQADIMGTKVRQDLPDMGVDACRYTFFLEGNTQQLRLVSWDAERRVDKTMPFQWKPDVWYRLKLKVTIKPGEAVIQGKVWEAGKVEPKEWTTEFTDTCPNREGAPGLYGFSTGIISPTKPGAHIYYDNVSVTPNEK